MDCVSQLQKNKASKDAMVNGLAAMRRRIESATKQRGMPAWEAGDANVRQAGKEFKRMLERFGGGRSLDPLTATFKTLRRRVTTDAELRDIAESGIAYLERAISDVDYSKSEDCQHRGANLIRSARLHLYKHYRGEMVTIANETDEFVTAFKRDPLAQRLTMQLRRVYSDLFTTRDGEARIRPRLVRDFVTFVGPMLLQELSVIHVPPIQHSDRSFDVAIEPFDISTRTLVPRSVQVKVGHDLFVGVVDGMSSDMRQELDMVFNGIFPVITGVPFSYRTKGVPRISDSGIADLRIVGEQGFNVRLSLDMYPDDPTTTIIPTKVDIDTGKIRLKVRNSKHDKLYRLLSPVLNRILRTQVVETVKDHIVGLIDTLDRQVTAIKLQTKPPSERPLDEQEMLLHHLDQFLSALGFAGTAEKLEEATGAAGRGSRGEVTETWLDYEREQEEQRRRRQEDEELHQLEEEEYEEEMEMEEPIMDEHEWVTGARRRRGTEFPVAKRPPTDYSSVPWATNLFDNPSSRVRPFHV
ncbi:hypothetical protein BC831DRAFT_511569 [Entophlyctis helioformis]|nr:hypothetical protein BC831DRAFT_511569 [Entophlyctis helioformis]